ncbi:MAG: hypothetical protein NTW96_26755 [Planctomycetia bacterium]|nr:hypothetical protein [Planctomycetia bacterium]
MNEASRKNLGEVLRRMGDPRRAADGLRTDRDRIARVVRAARIRVKLNKEKNGGFYEPDPRD